MTPDAVLLLLLAPLRIAFLRIPDLRDDQSEAAV